MDLTEGREEELCIKVKRNPELSFIKKFPYNLTKNAKGKLTKIVSTSQSSEKRSISIKNKKGNISTL